MNASNGFFGHVITAMVTPMMLNAAATKPCAQDDLFNAVDIDYECAEKLAVHLVNQGSDALVISGTTGEAPVTHLDEKGLLIRRVRTALEKAFPGRRVPLIGGVGSNDTAHVLANIKVAVDAGVDALLIVTPYYSRPSQHSMQAHFENIAKATDLPIILYDVPGRSGVKIAPKTYLALAGIPNVVAIKDATGDVFSALKTLTCCNEKRSALGLPDLTLYSGDDGLLLPFLSVGASGIISVASHLVSSGFKESISAWNEGDTARALDEFRKCVWAVDLLNGAGQQAAATKAALFAQGLLGQNVMRLPNCAFSGDEYATIADKVHENIGGALNNK
ncbi:MAG: 4-hydroxy-tetrahydrodipicolinate synthase [Candidatus Ancillula sp.]|nr:4-hydroxy-tetrahydrodipicolinate synthase [Candidatus Ancillula sp.]